MTAAMRSALPSFGRRACITAPPRMPPLRQAAVSNVEGLQWYSNESSKVVDNKKCLLMKGNSEMFLSTWSKRSRETLKTIMEANRNFYALAVFGLTAFSIPVTVDMWRLSDEPDDKYGGKK